MSLRNHASQEAILFELDRLKSSIDDALRASLRPAGGFSHSLGDQSDAKVARNLRNLVEAARHFHSAASSTASTIRDGSSAQSQAGRALSLMGDLPAFKRERVEAFIRAGRAARQQSPSPASGQRSSPVRARSPRRSNSPARSHRAMSFVALDSTTIPESNQTIPEDDDDVEDDDADIERQFLNGLEELAKDRFKNRDYIRATQFLNEATKRGVGANSANEELRQLQIQLALCHFFQGHWKAAEPIVLSLSRSKASLDIVVCNLLHAISLAHLAEYSFESALSTCRQALQGKKRLLKSKTIEEHEYAKTLALFATICDMTGDYIRAEVFRQQLPADFKYIHPACEVSFIKYHPSLLKTVLGDDVPNFEVERPAGTSKLDAGSSGITHRHSQSLRRNGTIVISPLKTKFTHHERYEKDTSKEVVIFESPPTASASEADSGVDLGADDEASTNPPTPVSPLKRRLTRMFAPKRPKLQINDVGRVPEVDMITAESVVTPSSRWFKGASLLGLKKSKTLRRRELDEAVATLRNRDQSERRSNFRLLNMERMTIEKLSDPSYRLGRRVGFVNPSLDSIDESELCSLPKRAKLTSISSTNANANVLSNDADDCHLDSFTTRNGILYVDVFRGDAAHRPRSSSHNAEPFDFGFEPKISELSDNSVSSFKAGASIPPDSLVATYLKTNAAAYWPLGPRWRPAGDLVTTTTVAGCSGTKTTETHNLRSTSHEFSDCSRPGFRAAASQGKERVVSKEEPLSIFTSGSVENPNSQSHVRVPSPLRVRTKATTDTAAIPSRLAEMMISLPRLNPTTDGQNAKRKLEVLLQDIRLLCNDHVLCQDLQRIIKSLNDAQHPDNVHRDVNSSDSGYETMEKEEPGKSQSDSDSESEGAASSLTRRDSKFLKKSKININVLGATPTGPALKREFSFVAGAEAENTMFRASEPAKDYETTKSQSEPENVTAAQTPKKQVSWEFEAEPPGKTDAPKDESLSKWKLLEKAETEYEEWLKGDKEATDGAAKGRRTGGPETYLCTRT